MKNKSFNVLAIFFFMAQLFGLNLAWATDTTVQNMTTQAVGEHSSNEDKAAILRFGVFGDIPYGKSDYDQLYDVLVPRLNSLGEPLPFVLHTGDIGRPVKEGNPGSEYSACYDKFRNATLNKFVKNFSMPVFITPGDNDWTDCNERRLPGSGLDPLNELYNFRLFFSVSPYMKNKRKEFPAYDKFPAYETQPNYPENQLWVKNEVLFVTQHYVGSDNGWVEGNDRLNKEVLARVTANIYWLVHAFSIAAKKPTKEQPLSIKAIVILTHVDPFESVWDLPQWKNKETIPATDELSRCIGIIGHWPANPLYSQLCRDVREEQETKVPEMPVLIVHGDTNAHCMDQPSPKDNLLWRLNAPGDFMTNPDIDIVSVDPTNTQKPFSVAGLISKKAPVPMCSYERFVRTPSGKAYSSRLTVLSGVKKVIAKITSNDGYVQIYRERKGSPVVTLLCSMHAKECEINVGAGLSIQAGDKIIIGAENQFPNRLRPYTYKYYFE